MKLHGGGVGRAGSPDGCDLVPKLSARGKVGKVTKLESRIVEPVFAEQR
jgi:hypothetical protein